MTRPDSGSPDQSANQDDAVWLDLVARLEGTSTENGRAAGGSTAEDATAPFDPDRPDNEPGMEDPGKPGPGPAGTSGRPAVFSDFDPLGLAGRAPTELSAAERAAAARTGGTGQSGSNDAAAGSGGNNQDRADGNDGPRDYAVEDDGGDFVPAEPPSLSGTDPLTMLAWLGAVGGPIALLLSAMFWRSAPLLAIVGIVSVFILAVVYLIMKLPQEKDDNDDGARV
ncbi:hypothetical protein [Pseudarthrobacter sulfonivorans]|uniref:hypothetical protein n=1 Tax=Pseudarthrobacter sulfonivorans TaxID=121292 RepID=UPI002107E641|nr:hypothetical protein [Pseudarthrobacter sulfonivorans]